MKVTSANFNGLALGRSCLFAEDFEGGASGPVLTPSTPTGVLFRSIGTDATGTLNAWSGTGSTISANVVSVPAQSPLLAGHVDWTDYLFQQRFVFSTGTQPGFLTRMTGGFGYFVLTSATVLNIYKGQPTSPSLVNASTVTLVSGTAYWMRITLNGTSITAQIFNDSGGAIGTTLIATNTATDATYSAGQIGLFSNVGTSSFGGPFSNACLVQGATPAGWTPTVNAGEPAFAWSAAQSYSGSRSASVYNAHTSGDGYWSGPALTPQSVPYKLSAQIRATGAGTAEIGENGTYQAVSANDSAWHLASETITPAAPGVAARMAGAGTAYFDSIDLSTTTPIKIVEVAGLDDQAPVRNGNIPKSADHGAFLGTNWLDARIADFHLRIAGQAGQVPLDNLIDSLRLATIVQATQELPLVLNGTRQLSARATKRIVSDKIDDWGSAWTAEVSLEFESSDPRIYGNQQSQYVFTAGQTQGVLNTGNFPTRPVATISGAVTNPEILDVTTGAWLKFTLTMITTDTLVIDFNARTIQLNGTNSYSALTSDSAWFDLAAGVTSIQYVASGASTMTLTYRSAWV